MAERGQFKRTFKFLSEAIATGAYEKGAIACYDTATDNFKPAAAANANLIPVGHFTKSGTGDGTTVVANVIELFEEVVCYGFTNAGSNSVAATDRFSNVYLDGPSTVCNLATGRSVAGKFVAFARLDDGFGATGLCYVAIPDLN
jgi:hypothetical protein